MTQSDISHLSSRTISSLRVVCILMVVFIHTFDLVADSDPCATHSPFQFVRIAVSRAICLPAVPVFFVISAYLLCGGLSDSWSWALWRRKMVSRLHSMLIPFLLWNAIALLAKVVVAWAQADISSSADLLAWFQAHGWLRIWWDCANPNGGMPIDYPLWFLRDLVILSLLLPLVYFLVRKLGLFWIVFVAVIGLADLWPHSLKPQALPVIFFSAGVFLRLRRLDIARVAQLHLPWAIPATLVLLVACTLSYNVNQPLYAVVSAVVTVPAAFALVGLVARLLSRSSCSFPDVLSQASFFIYALHAVFVISAVRRLLFALWPSESQCALIAKFFLIPVIATTVCIAVFLLLRRSCPALLNLLTGGRG